MKQVDVQQNVCHNIWIVQNLLDVQHILSFMLQFLDWGLWCCSQFYDNFLAAGMILYNTNAFFFFVVLQRNILVKFVENLSARED